MNNKTYILIGLVVIAAIVIYLIMKKKSGSLARVQNGINAVNASLFIPEHTRYDSGNLIPAATYNVSDKVMDKINSNGGFLDFAGSGANGDYGSWVTYFGFDSNLAEIDIPRQWYPTGTNWWFFPVGSILSISYTTFDGKSNYTTRGQYDKIEIPSDETLLA
tara:strand:- start:136 stop:621 length:486 start_codon:yes stop_codon:yes gene_type:complete